MAPTCTTDLPPKKTASPAKKKASHPKAKSGVKSKSGIGGIVNHWRGKPKRPLSAYNLFFQAERDRILPGGNKEKKVLGFLELAEIIADQWKALDDEGRAKYEVRAREERGRYESDLRKWRLARRSEEEEVFDRRFRSTAAAKAEHDNAGTSTFTSEAPHEATAAASQGSSDHQDRWAASSHLAASCLRAVSPQPLSSYEDNADADVDAAWATIALDVKDKDIVNLDASFSFDTPAAVAPAQASPETSFTSSGSSSSSGGALPTLAPLDGDFFDFDTPAGLLEPAAHASPLEPELTAGRTSLGGVGSNSCSSSSSSLTGGGAALPVCLDLDSAEDIFDDVDIDIDFFEKCPVAAPAAAARQASPRGGGPSGADAPDDLSSMLGWLMNRPEVLDGL